MRNVAANENNNIKRKYDKAKKIMIKNKDTKKLKLTKWQ